MSYARLSKKPLLFRSFTGLEISEFNAIYAEVESTYNELSMKESVFLEGREKGK